MSVAEPAPSAKSRFAWFGTLKGALALAGTVVGLALGIFALADRIGGGEAATPSFEGSVTTQAGARDFVDFLIDHDQEIVDVDVSCALFEATRPAPGCSADLPADFAPDVAVEGELHAVLELFTKRACPASDGRSRCPGTYWAFLRVGQGQDEQVANGRFGAGGLVVKGQFKSLLRGPSGAAPSDVKVIELIATD